MKRVIIFMVLVVSHVSDSVIYRLNETEYLQMPPLYHLDDYELCLYQQNGIYCYSDINLVSDSPSALLNMIHEYSEHTTTHFNYTQLHHGTCLTKTCKKYLKEYKNDTRMVLERCLNESLWKDYQLQTRLGKVSCTKMNERMILNTEDLCAAVFFLCLGLLNIIGSVYDICLTNGVKGNKLLLSFAFKRNLEKLLACDKTDPLRVRLKGISGLRVLSIMLVILAHAPLKFIISAENPHALEQIYYNIAYHLYLNGTVIVQTFFVTTGCLMAYNIRMHLENNKLTWILIPQKIMMRWLRLTPAFAVVFIFTLTWVRFLGSGPLWEVVVNGEVVDCHRDGWWNMIYLNNYIDFSQCMAQTWFLAASMQLYILGIFVCILINYSKYPNVWLSTLFIIGAVIPAIHTYVQDLDAIVLMTPESSRNFFVNDPTFNHTYKRGHTNISSIVLGIALGNLMHSGLKGNKKMTMYKRLGFVYYLTVPICAVLPLSGIIFYMDRPRSSVYLRTILAALIRPLFLFLIAIFFIGMVFKFENIYRRIVEWRGWNTPDRVSYSAYLLHVSVIRVYAGMNSTLSRVGCFLCLKEAFGILVVTFLIAIPFWLFVEAPLNQAVLIILGLSKREKNGHWKQNVDSITNKHDQNVTGIQGEEYLEINSHL